MNPVTQTNAKVVRAVLSIGTNSTRVLVADVTDNALVPILAHATGTRLGEGLGADGEIGAEPLERTLHALAGYAEQARRHTEEVAVVATSAARRARNRDLFSARVEAIVGAPLQILTGEDEARYAFAGATLGLPPARYGVLDSGGGSTEYAVGTPDAIEAHASLEIGAVRLTEAVPELAGNDGAVADEVRVRAADLAMAALEPLRAMPRVDRALFVGGSATTAVSLLAKNREPFVRRDLSLDELDALFADLCMRSLEERRALPGINPQRADIIAAGVLILRTACRLLQKNVATVSTGDLLAGILLAAARVRGSVSGTVERSQNV